MNMQKKKKLTMVAGAVSAFLAIIIVLCATSDWRTRWSIKHECGAGMDCACFSNVIDNRLDTNQVRAFHSFLKSVKRRPTTNILEFTDEVSARGISAAIALCRPVQQQPSNAQPKGKK